jgi:hypothetical protein
MRYARPSLLPPSTGVSYGRLSTGSQGNNKGLISSALISIIRFRVVQLPQDLKVEIEALYVVRQRDSPRYSLLRFSTTSRMNLRAPMNTFTAQKRAEGH